MGLTATDLDLLIDLCERGYRPAQIATIGRQALYLHPRQLQRLRHLFPDADVLSAYTWGEYCERALLAITGATEIVSIDVSDYEGATRVHDMNEPIAQAQPDLLGRFDLVVDGGTLEHVFDFPTAAANVMAIARVGGYVLTANPANNLCGHGFYQFTPELMHRLYSERNGFDIDRILLTSSKTPSVERDPRPVSLQVNDPLHLGRRVLIRNSRPIMIRALARKVAEIPLEARHVQQSDYVKSWADAGEAAPAARPRAGVIKTIYSKLPRRVQWALLDRLSMTPFRPGKAMARWRGAIS